MVDRHDLLIERENSITSKPSAFGAELETTSDYFNSILAAANFIKKEMKVEKFDVAVVFGSGHKTLADEVDNPRELKYAAIPFFPIPTNIGHGRELVVGQIHGKNVILFKGRIHFFEGYRSFYHAWLGYLTGFLGCELLISTNSCGSILTSLHVGDFAIMSDHLNCSYLPFLNAPLLDDKLRHKEHSNYIKSATFGYDEDLINLSKQCGKEAGLELIDGCYNVWPLPNFESAAEIQYTKEAGATVSGASTVPEQMAASLLGVKSVGFAAVTNPASGIAEGWVHDGENNLIAAKKCLEGLRKVIWKLIERFQFNPEHTHKINLHGINSLRLKQFPHNHIEQQHDQKLVSCINLWNEDKAPFKQCLWFMSQTLYDQFMDKNHESISSPFFISLNSIAQLRTRSYEESQIVLLKCKGEQWILIRQPFLEGMLPNEYSLILKALKELQITNINVFFEASSVSDDNLNGHVHRVKYYFNRRFFKLSETKMEYENEIENQLNPSEEELLSAKTLYVSEGSMLPTRTELSLAKKTKFDLYTITNFSFMDLAYHFNMKPNLFAVAKKDLSNRIEEVKAFGNLELFKFTNHHTQIDQPEVTLKRRSIDLKYDAVFDLVHSKDSIYEISSKFKEVVGLVDNVMVLERESYEVLLNELQSEYKLEKAVRLNLKDYKDNKHVDILKITTKDNIAVIVISDTLAFQSHVPYQSLLLPMRIVILGADAKNFISCPHIWNIKWERNPETFEAGDLFVVKDHANISAQSPGIGPNIDEFGPRFYDICSMYETDFTKMFRDVIGSQSLKHAYGEVFWISNSSVPSVAFKNMAEGLSNQKVCFNGITKTGISELMAVHHRAGYSPYKLTSGMIGLITDSVIRRQQQHDKYNNGVKNLVTVAFESFKQQQEKLQQAKQ